MAVDQKIKNAYYFLNKIKIATNSEDFIPNLSAFLSETCSIPEYLLEDANVKFGLGIPPEDKLLRVFRQRAVGNQKALKWFYRFNGKYKILSKGSIGKLLIGKRNVTVHRKGQEVNAKFTRELTETLDIHDSVAVEDRDKYGNIKSRSDTRDTNVRLEPKEQSVMKENEWTLAP
jgi:hypothetical protein